MLCPMATLIFVANFQYCFGPLKFFIYLQSNEVVNHDIIYLPIPYGQPALLPAMNLIKAMSSLFLMLWKYDNIDPECKCDMDLVTTKTVFGVSDKARFKPVSLVTETS